MTNWGWVSRELAGAKVSQDVNETSVMVLQKLEQMQAKFDLSDDDVRVVLDCVHKLGLGHSIAVEEKPEKWGPVVPGAYSIGDTIRVKPDAYEGERGTKHNGKRGRVTAARDGLVLCVYEDAFSADIQYRHAPVKLQRLLS